MPDPRDTITRDDLIAFLKEKNAQRECEACGTNQWATLPDLNDDRSAAFGVINTGNNNITYAGLGVCALVCDNCTNTRIFWRASILMWKQARRSSVG